MLASGRFTGRQIEDGEALFAYGTIEEAEKCFLKILEHDSQNIASHWES